MARLSNLNDTLGFWLKAQAPRNADGGTQNQEEDRCCAHAAPFSTQILFPTTYWYATAHDVPYPEFICQVMMLLAQKFSRSGK
jgi:hypothetical protein